VFGSIDVPEGAASTEAERQGRGLRTDIGVIRIGGQYVDGQRATLLDRLSWNRRDHRRIVRRRDRECDRGEILEIDSVAQAMTPFPLSHSLSLTWPIFCPLWRVYPPKEYLTGECQQAHKVAHRNGALRRGAVLPEFER
jgi:hypothetical protein